MDIVPDPILIAILAIPFFVSMAVLYLVLFRPTLDYLDERAKVSRDARHDAGELEHRVADRVNALQQRLTEARNEVAKRRSAARLRALAEEASILEAARGQAEQQIDSAVARIQQERSVAESALRTQASTLAHDIAVRVLGREITA